MAYSYITDAYSAGIVNLVLPEIDSLANLIIHEGSFLQIKYPANNSAGRKLIYIRVDSASRQNTTGKGTGEDVVLDVNITGSAYEYVPGVSLEAYKYYIVNYIITSNTTSPYDDAAELNIINEQQYANDFTEYFNGFGFDTSVDPLPDWMEEACYVNKSNSYFVDMSTGFIANANDIKIRVQFNLYVGVYASAIMDLLKSEDDSMGLYRPVVSGSSSRDLNFTFCGSTVTVENAAIPAAIDPDVGIVVATAEAKNGNMSLSVDIPNLGVHEKSTGTYNYTSSSSPWHAFGIPSNRNGNKNISYNIYRIEMWKSGVKVVDMIPVGIVGYKLYEYIVFSGTQYMTIPQISANNKVRIEIGLLPNPQTSQPTFIGVAGKAIQLYHNSTNLLLWYRDASNISHSATIGAFNASDVNNLSLEFTSSGMTYKLNNNAANTVSSSVLFNMITGGNILLGLYGSSTYDYNFYGNIYYFRIYCDDVPVRYMIPCKKTLGGIIGMYDSITQTLFENSGTGVFTNGSSTTGMYDNIAGVLRTPDIGRLSHTL